MVCRLRFALLREHDLAENTPELISSQINSNFTVSRELDRYFFTWSGYRNLLFVAFLADFVGGEPFIRKFRGWTCNTIREIRTFLSYYFFNWEKF